VVSDVGSREWTDPGIELLFGQFGSESIASALPKVGNHVVENFFSELQIVRPEDARKRTCPQHAALRQGAANPLRVV
jgi:hypothetical protein